MTLGGAGGQNIKNHRLVSVYFFVKCILILLARRDSGKLCYPVTALTIDVFSFQNMNVCAVPKPQYGNFYTGDSYIVLSVCFFFLVFVLYLQWNRMMVIIKG